MYAKPRITKAIFPVAGLGTRFLPATKANPKEMLPIVDKPLIQYAVEEAIQAGITELVFVTSSSKRAIEDHFDTHYELEQSLAEQGKADLLHSIQHMIPRGVDCIYVRQPRALGLGHAVLCAQQVIGYHPFAVLLADDLIQAKTPCLKQMVELYEQTLNSVIAVQPIARHETEKYGVVGLGPDWQQGKGGIRGIVEKPKPDEAPSTYGVVGRYILTPGIFDHLTQVLPGRNGEIQLTDAIASLNLRENIMALEFAGKRFDCGSKLGYMQAVIHYGLHHPELRVALRTYLENLQLELTTL